MLVRGNDMYQEVSNPDLMTTTADKNSEQDINLESNPDPVSWIVPPGTIFSWDERRNKKV